MINTLLYLLVPFVLLKSFNIATFSANVVEVLVPGWLDGQQDDKMWGEPQPTKAVQQHIKQDQSQSSHWE